MAQDVARTEEKPAVHPVDQVLPVPKLAIYGFQHVLAFYAGAVIVPICGIFPKVGAVVAAIPPPVLGGAAYVLFGTVAVVGIQILRRVDFHDERNVIVLAVSLAMAITPTDVPGYL